MKGKGGGKGFVMTVTDSGAFINAAHFRVSYVSGRTAIHRTMSASFAKARPFSSRDKHEKVCCTLGQWYLSGVSRIQDESLDSEILVASSW